MGDLRFPGWQTLKKELDNLPKKDPPITAYFFILQLTFSLPATAETAIGKFWLDNYRTQGGQIRKEWTPYFLKRATTTSGIQSTYETNFGIRQNNRQYQLVIVFTGTLAGLGLTIPDSIALNEEVDVTDAITSKDQVMYIEIDGGQRESLQTHLAKIVTDEAGVSHPVSFRSARAPSGSKNNAKTLFVVTYHKALLQSSNHFLRQFMGDCSYLRVGGNDFLLPHKVLRIDATSAAMSYLIQRFADVKFTFSLSPRSSLIVFSDVATFADIKCAISLTNLELRGSEKTQKVFEVYGQDGVAWGATRFVVIGVTNHLQSYFG